MANNYQMFSTGIENMSQEEKDWWTNTIDELENSEKEYEGYVDFQWSLDSDDMLWLRAEESGDVDQVCSLVQQFLLAHRPQAIFTIEWANTCSKPRLDQFGGGAAVVTSEDIEQMTTSWWVQEQIERIKKERGEEKHEVLL